MKSKIFNIGIFLALSMALAIPEALAIHFWSSEGFTVSRVGVERFDDLVNWSKQGPGCSIIDNQLNCPANSGVTYAPQPNPDGNTLPNLSTNTNNFTIEWDMQILSSCQNGWYPIVWASANASLVNLPISIAYDSQAVRLWKSDGIQIIKNVLPDDTWHHWKATFYANSSSINSLSIAINGTDYNNIQIPSDNVPISMSFQFENDDCSINADNLTMYNGTVFPAESSPDAALTIVKIVVNNDTGNKDVSDFILKVNGTTAASGVPMVLPPGFYAVSEVADPGYNSAITGDCTPDGSIDLKGGDSKTCFITNDDVAPLGNSTLTLIKITVNNDTCRLNTQSFILKVNETIVEEGVPNSFPPGFYNVNEVENPDYVASFLGDCDSSGNIVLEEEQDKTCIILNDDITPGIIKGMKFRDLNGNGIKNANESGLASWRIYIDSNDNGIRNAHESSVLTNVNGTYSFKGLGKGTYILREILRPGWIQTSPIGGKHIVTINGSGSVIDNVDFGNRKT